MKRFGTLLLSALLLTALLIMPAQAAACYSDGGGSITLGIIICFLLGLLIAFLVVGILKGQLKSVAAKMEADQYSGPDALELTHHDDVYTHTTRDRRYDPVEKDKD